VPYANGLRWRGSPLVILRIRICRIPTREHLLACVQYSSIGLNNPAVDFSKYQLNAQLFYSSTIYMLHYAPQLVSSSTLLMMRGTNCITTASGIVTLCKQP